MAIRTEAQKRYSKSPKGRLSQQRSRERHAVRIKGYRKTAECKASHLKYKSSAKGKLAIRRLQLRAYGLSLEGFEKLLQAQGGHCALCFTNEKTGARS